jgi:CRISPR system Cascade subunit CasC
MAKYIDLEIIHTLPFSNANRDDAGLPKTVTVGGVSRGRLSSQSLKRAARFYNFDANDRLLMQQSLNSESGYFRTKNVLGLVAQRVSELGGTADQIAKIEALAGDKSPLGKAKKDKVKENSDSKKDEPFTIDDKLLLSTLVVITNEEINALAQKIVDGIEITPKVIESIFIDSSKKDLALWGRFFASSPQLTLDGAAQVAHALTTHSVNIENDFFVGLDDSNDLFEKGSGASQPGDAFYLTGTFYKYANICVDELVRNLLNVRLESKNITHADLSMEELKNLAREVIADFIESFVLTVPQGKIRSTAHNTLPSFVRAAVRSNRPVSGATAFDSPLWNGNDLSYRSASRLADEHASLKMFVKSPIYSGYISTDKDADNNLMEFGEEKNSLNDLVEAIIEHVEEMLESLYVTFTGN